MLKKLLISLIAISILTTTASFANKANPLREETLIVGIEGRLISDANSNWFFQFSQDITDKKNTIPAGTQVPLLSSSTLEKLIYVHQQDPNSQFRLWARVMTFNEKNYLFPAYFIRTVADTAPAEPNQLSDANDVNDVNAPAEKLPVLRGSDDEFRIPEKILKKLRPTKIIRTSELKKNKTTGLTLKQDCILADRTGFINKTSDGSYEFVLDGIGRNIDGTAFPLLPCQTLELVLAKQTKRLEPIRFTISGIVTQFKSGNFLILQKAQQTFSHGNLGR